MTMTKRAPTQFTDSLRTIPLFSGCDRRELSQVARLGTVVEVRDRATLTVQGRPGHEFVLVMAGRARCLIDGTEVATFGPGDYFGELALLDGGPRTATVVADGDGRCLVLDRREFYDLLDLVVPVAKKLLVELARRYRTGSTRERLPAGL
jgi:CRP-like cAMP-binding protein